MRLSGEQIADLKEYFTRSIKGNISSLVHKLSTDGINLLDIIEALQQENERLKDTNEQLRNDNINAEMNLSHITTEYEQLQAQVARMREALEHIAEYWNGDTNEKAMEDACWHAIETTKEALVVDDLTLQGWVCPNCGEIVFPQKEVRKEEGEMKRRKARGEEG